MAESDSPVAPKKSFVARRVEEEAAGEAPTQTELEALVYDLLMMNIATASVLKRTMMLLEGQFPPGVIKLLQTDVDQMESRINSIVDNLKADG